MLRVLLLLKVSVSSGVFFLSIPNFVISTSSELQEISVQTGFNSIANFSYAFKKDIGFSPLEFRERPL